MMKRCLFAWAALLLCIGLHAQYRTTPEDLNDSEAVRAFKEHVGYLASAALEGRKAGSEGEKMAAAYVREKFQEVGLDILPTGNDFGISHGADTLHSCNVTGFLQGSDPVLREHYIVVGARLDNLGTDTLVVDGEPLQRIYYGANGNASGLALLLELAGKLSLSRGLLKRSVLFVAFGGSLESFSGAWYFLNRSFAADAGKIDAMVNLDMLGLPGSSGLLAYTASNPDLNTLVQSLQGSLLPIQATVVTQEPYPGDHIVFYEKEIPSILFTTGRYPEHGTGRDQWNILDYEGMEKELEYLYQFAQQLCTGPKPLFRNSQAAAQDQRPAGVYAFADVDVKPMFLNSPDPLSFLERWVYPYLKYPAYAVENGIQGRVLVSFIVDENGKVQDVKVSRGVHESLDSEALRVVQASPKWRPGRHHGKKVKVAVTVAIDFKLEKSKGKFGINGKTVK